MNKKIVRKLITLGFTVFLTSFTLISSTYAFIILRRDAGIEDFTFGVKAVEGLQLSLDGKNFSQDISYDQITSKIEENAGVSFDAIKFNGVTPKAENGKVLYNGNSNVPLFVKDSLVLDPSADPTGKNDIFYRHETEDALSNEFVYFDLYYRIASTSSLDYTKKYNLKFYPNSDSDPGTKITSDESNVVLTNACRDVKYEYTTNSEITVKNEDAMRLGVVDENKSITVFEPNYGHGSSAIEGVSYNESSDEQDDSGYNYNLYHDKNYNLMYTYYNSTNPTAYFQKAADDNESFHTEHSFNDKVLGSFEALKDESGKPYSYNTIKLTFVLWLEGWDADYIFGVEANEISVKLKFKIEEIKD